MTVPAELPDLTRNARETMGGLYEADRHPISDEEAERILERANR